MIKAAAIAIEDHDGTSADFLAEVALEAALSLPHPGVEIECRAAWERAAERHSVAP